MAQGFLYLSGNGSIDIALGATPGSTSVVFSDKYLNLTTCGPSAGVGDSVSGEAVVVDTKDYLRISWDVKSGQPRRADWSTT